MNRLYLALFNSPESKVWKLGTSISHEASLPKTFQTTGSQSIKFRYAKHTLTLLYLKLVKSLANSPKNLGNSNSYEVSVPKTQKQNKVGAYQKGITHFVLFLLFDLCKLCSFTSRSRHGNTEFCQIFRHLAGRLILKLWLTIGLLHPLYTQLRPLGIGIVQYL